MLSQKAIEKALNHTDNRIVCAAVGNCSGNVNLSVEFVDKLRKSYIPSERQAAMLACANAQMPVEWVLEGLGDYDFLVKDAAAKVLKYRDDVPMDVIVELLHSKWWYEKHAGVNACVSKNLPLKTVREWVGYGVAGFVSSVFCDAAAAACINNGDIPYGLVERILYESKSVGVKLMAAKAFRGQDVPVDEVVTMLGSSDKFVQLAGLYAYSTDMAVPYVTVGEKLIAEDIMIRRVAATVCDKSRPKTLRVVEPEKYVYKKCVGGVIVVASIPERAQIRGNKSRGYRTDKVVIEDVIGDFCGEPVGVSLCDHTVEYRVGDEVVIEDFDFSYEAMSTGFHFFTDFARAESF